MTPLPKSRSYLEIERAGSTDLSQILAVTIVVLDEKFLTTTVGVQLAGILSSVRIQLTHDRLNLQ